MSIVYVACKERSYEKGVEHPHIVGLTKAEVLAEAYEESRQNHRGYKIYLVDVWTGQRSYIGRLSNHIEFDPYGERMSLEDDGKMFRVITFINHKHKEHYLNGNGTLGDEVAVQGD